MRPQSDSKICGNVHPACLDTRYQVCFFNILTKSSNSICEFSLSTLRSQLELCILILSSQMSGKLLSPTMFLMCT
ncbi:hypothetical protein Hanom_Chr16g01471131 [Helianthus anomalus]